MFSPMMSLLILSLLIIPTLLTGRINEQFVKLTISFVVSIFSSTFILLLVAMILVVVNIFI